MFVRIAELIPHRQTTNKNEWLKGSKNDRKNEF